jgi:eukaryotic-like serine/threonine-protein kinase
MLDVGTQVGPYKVVAPLGSGGMGEVYRVRDTRLGREVALKMLPERLAQDRGARARFEREARALAALSHPNVLAIHDFCAESGHCYVVTELLDGQTLRARLRAVPMAWPEAVAIALAVAEGLAKAHAEGVIHRDLKPENIFLTADGGVRILDFGLARLEQTKARADESTALLYKTREGMTVGTVPYMSPEQVRGGAIDGRSDLFSLGCVLYEMVRGRPPFLGRTSGETMAMILRDMPPAPEGPAAPPELERIIGRLLSKEPRDRYGSARELAGDLKGLACGPPDPAPAAAGERKGPAAALAETAETRVTEPMVRPAAAASRPRRRTRRIDSLAILPLRNASGDPAAEYLGDGITESLINGLARLPKLRVLASSTVFRYKGRDVEPVPLGRELGVHAVLAGRVLTLGDSLVVAAELVDVADGRQLWGEHYRRPAADIFAVQEEIGREIARTLLPRLTGAQRRQLARRYTEHPEAYRCYLRGRYHWNKRSAEALRKGIECFQQAIDLEPKYALAYTGMADSSMMLGLYGLIPPAESFPRAQAAARRALEIDPDLAEAHASLSTSILLYDWDWPRAEASAHRALELNPDYAAAHSWYGLALAMIGRWDRAFAAMIRAQELDPLSLSIMASTGLAQYQARRYDQAIATCRRAVELEPDFALARYYLGLCLEQLGDPDGALAEFRRARELDDRPDQLAAIGRIHAAAGRIAEAESVGRELEELAADRYVSPFAVATLAAALGQNDRAFRLLDDAYRQRAVRLVWLDSEPVLDAIRPDPRLAALWRRIGLAQGA